MGVARRRRSGGVLSCAVGRAGLPGPGRRPAPAGIARHHVRVDQYAGHGDFDGRGRGDGRRLCQRRGRRRGSGGVERVQPPAAAGRNVHAAVSGRHVHLVGRRRHPLHQHWIRQRLQRGGPGGDIAPIPATWWQPARSNPPRRCAAAADRIRCGGVSAERIDGFPADGPSDGNQLPGGDGPARTP